MDTIGTTAWVVVQAKTEGDLEVVCNELGNNGYEIHWIYDRLTHFTVVACNADLYEDEEEDDE